MQRRDFQLSYQLEGSTSQSSGVPLIPSAGLRWSRTLPDGSVVRQDEVVGTWAVDPDYKAELTMSAATSRVDADRLKSLGAHAGDVLSPVPGAVRVSADLVSVLTKGIDVVVVLTGIQELRLSSLTISGQATVETVAGQRTVSCQALWTEDDVTTDPAATDTGDGISAQLRCRLPQVVETVPGLRAQLHVTSATIAGALVVPDTMLGYDQTGYTVTLRQDGRNITVPVDVGPSDGVVRVVTTDLPVGAVLVPPSTTP